MIACDVERYLCTFSVTFRRILVFGWTRYSMVAARTLNTELSGASEPQVDPFASISSLCKKIENTLVVFPAQAVVVGYRSLARALAAASFVALAAPILAAV